MSDRALWRVKDAAEHLSLHEREIRRLIAAGILHKRYTSRRSYRITAASLDAYVASLSSEASA